ncbi:hypothetical protein H0H93_003903 [Arthromyces matolae]|nr:hypothetical protein H0H93_003903 [Arthromyces matolae]
MKYCIPLIAATVISGASAIAIPREAGEYSHTGQELSSLKGPSPKAMWDMDEQKSKIITVKVSDEQTIRDLLVSNNDFNLEESRRVVEDSDDLPLARRATLPECYEDALHQLDSAMKQLCQRRETAFNHRDQRAVDEIDDAIHATAAAQKGVRKAADAAEYLQEPGRGRPEQHSSPIRPAGPPRAPTPPSALSGERYRNEHPRPSPQQRPTSGVSYVSAPSNYRGSNQGYGGSTSAQQPRRDSQHYENIRPPADNYRGNDRGSGYRYRRRALDSSPSPISNRSEVKTGAVNLKGRDLLLD